MPFKKKPLYLFSFGLLTRLILAWLPEDKLLYLISDDAYYYFTIARNLVDHGMLSADGIIQTNGFHPLWLFVITPVYFFFKSSPWLAIHLVGTASAIFDTAAGFLIYKTLERLGKEKLGFWAAAFYLINPYGLQHTMNGLETAQNNFFLALLVYLSVRVTPVWLKSGWLLLGTVCGLTLLSRTDNIFAVTAFLVYLLWRHRKLAAMVKTVGTAALLVLPWLAYNYQTFGTIVQTSGTAYPFLYHQHYLKTFGTYLSFSLLPYLLKLSFNEFTYYAFHYGNWMLTLLLGGTLTVQLWKNSEKFRPLFWTLAAAALFIGFHLFIRWSVRPWYPQAVFVLTLPAVALALEKVNRYLIALGTVLAFLSTGWWFSVSLLRTGERSLVMLQIIKNNVPPADRVGVFNSGYVQYFTDQKVINLDGLVNNEILPYYRQKKGLEYLRKRNVRWLVDTPAYLGVVFGEYFGPKAESSLAIVEGVQAVQDIALAGTVIGVVAVLPESIQAPPSRAVKIRRDVTSSRLDRPVPIPFVLRKVSGS